MNKKILFSFILFFTLFLVISCTSANENMTDVVSLNDNSSQVVSLEDDYGVAVLEEVDSPILGNDSTSSNDDVLGDDEDNQSSTNFIASDKSTYANLQDGFSIKLESNGVGLANKSVNILLNGVNHNGITDDNGKYSIKFKLNKGTYTVKYSFDGDEDYLGSNGTATITVKSSIATSIKVVDKYINYRQGLKSIFQVKLLDVNKNPIKSKYVSIKVNGKT